MRPPQALDQRGHGLAVAPGGVGVALAVGEGVVSAVIGDPADDRPFDGQRAADGQCDPKPAPGLERPVCEVAVEAYGDAMARDGICDHGDHHVVPAQTPPPCEWNGCQKGKERDGDEAEQGDLLDRPLAPSLGRSPGALDRRRVGPGRGVDIVEITSGGPGVGGHICHGLKPFVAK